MMYQDVIYTIVEISCKSEIKSNFTKKIRKALYVHNLKFKVRFVANELLSTGKQRVMGR